MIRLFCGYDRREAVGHHVFVQSVLERASQTVAVHAVAAAGLPVGSNEFTFSRFLVPWLCQFEGRAIFCDGADMLMRADIAELDALFDDRYAVQVVQRPAYQTRHPLKYVGTMLQSPNVNYARKQWASVMLLHCGAPEWRQFTPDTIGRMPWRRSLQFELFADDRIGSLPEAWNRVVDEGDPVDGAKLLHWTAGLPVFPHYASSPGAEIWFAERDRMLEIA